jgi:hypothetical protein
VYVDIFLRLFFFTRRVAPREGLRELKVKRPILEVTLVLGILGGIGGFRGCGSYSQDTKPSENILESTFTESHPHQSILSSYLIYPIRGGAIIGVFMI